MTVDRRKIEARAVPADARTFREAADTYYATDPRERHAPGTHWVMDLDSYKKIRYASWVYTGGDDDDPDKWVPDPRDTLLGLPIEVRDGGGKPHLETPQSETLNGLLQPRDSSASCENRQEP